MKLEAGEVAEPYEGRQVLAEAVVHVAVVASAPHGRGLDPRRPVLGAVLLIEELAVDPVRIALEGKRVIARVRQDGGRDAGVIVDDLRLGESDLRVQDLLEVGELERSVLDLDLDRGFLSHFRALPYGPACRSAAL